MELTEVKQNTLCNRRLSKEDPAELHIKNTMTHVWRANGYAQTESLYFDLLCSSINEVTSMFC